MPESKITKFSAGTVFEGRDAVKLFNAAALKSALGLLALGIAPTRGFTGKRGLAKATEYTGKPYKRGQYALAIADLQAWCDAMASALPIVDETKK